MRFQIGKGLLIGMLIGVALIGVDRLRAAPSDRAADPTHHNIGIAGKDGYDIQLVDTLNGVACYGANNYSNLSCVQIGEPRNGPSVVIPFSPSEDTAQPSSAASSASIVRTTAVGASPSTANATPTSGGSGRVMRRSCGRFPTRRGTAYCKLADRI
jgi:hypothetical protein